MKEILRKYEVKANSVKEFVNKYYKKDRMTSTMIETKEEEFLKYGYCMISHHDNVTGEIVTYYGNN